jgi:carboxylesterase type B
MAVMRRMLAGLVLLATAALAENAPTVTIKNGALQGVKCPSTDVNAFLSVPYAKPATRFTSPEPFDQSFSGTLNATVAAPTCPQFFSAWAESGPQSEDCLYLDV